MAMAAPAIANNKATEKRKKLVFALNSNELIDGICMRLLVLFFQLKLTKSWQVYLNVIKMLRPKYFVMENVKGILTKEGGKIREMILQEIRSIIDLKEFKKQQASLGFGAENFLQNA